MGQPLTSRTELAEAPASGDFFHVVDVSDTTDSPEGTSKKIQSQYLTISDASTTVKGKVELATDAETITGTDTVRAITPSNITAKIDTDGTLAGNSDTRIPSQKSVKTYADAKVADAINNGTTTIAPSQNAVFDALALKSNAGDDGWTPVSVTWTYLSASSVTVPSGAASLYQVGDRVKFTQTTVKYFDVSAVTDTTLTFFVNTDYTVANAAISSIYYSHQSNPIGFPHWFNCSVTVDWNGTDPSTPTTTAKYTINGRTLEFYFKQTNSSAGSGNTQVSVDGFPGSALSGSSYNKACVVTASTLADSSVPDTGSGQAPRGIIYGTTAPTIYAFFPSNTMRTIWISGSYQV